MTSWVILIAFATSGCALPRRVAERLERDLARCDELKGEEGSPLHHAIFGSLKIDGHIYRQFFEQRVQSISGEGILFASCHGALACMDGDRKLRLGLGYADLEMPQILRISFLMHEARHAESWPHAMCSEQTPSTSPYQRADLRGKIECDKSELGAYGIQYVWLVNIARHCADCSSLERKQALDYSSFIFELIQSPESRQRLKDDQKP